MRAHGVTEGGYARRTIYDRRFFEMAPGAVPGKATVNTGFGTFSEPLGSYLSAFSASELLVSVRIYEPFRGLLR